MKLRSIHDAVIDIEKEIQILRNNQNRYVITYFDTFNIRDYVCIVTEYSDVGLITDRNILLFFKSKIKFKKIEKKNRLFR